MFYDSPPKNDSNIYTRVVDTNIIHNACVYCVGNNKLGNVLYVFALQQNQYKSVRTYTRPHLIFNVAKRAVYVRLSSSFSSNSNQPPIYLPPTYSAFAVVQLFFSSIDAISSSSAVCTYTIRCSACTQIYVYVYS